MYAWVLILPDSRQLSRVARSTAEMCCIKGIGPGPDSGLRSRLHGAVD